MDGVRQEVVFVSGRDIPNLVLKEKKFNRLRAIKYNKMLISQFIQQLQNIYDEEGDMEIAIKIDDNDLGSEPIVVKSTVYEQLYIVNS